MKLQELKLERFDYYAQTLVSRELVEGGIHDVETSIREALDHQAYAIRTRVGLWGVPTHTERIEYPRDWWQAFKGRWVPRWAKRRWPPASTVVIVDARAWLPGFAAPKGLKWTPLIALRTYSQDRYGAGLELADGEIAETPE